MKTADAPEKITVCNGKEKELEEFLGISQDDLDEVNDFYKHYLFYEKAGRGRDIWTSCCHRKEHMELGTCRTLTREIVDALRGRHDYTIRCPFCGKDVTMKATGTAKSCERLEEMIPVVFVQVSEDGETIWVQAYATRKDYNRKRSRNYAAEPEYANEKIYRFRRGEAACWEYDSWSGNWYKQVNGFIGEPFRGYGMFPNYNCYKVVGLERLEHSFLRYTDYKNCEDRYHTYTNEFKQLCRFLALASQYPENVEMLMKAGMRDVIDDWIWKKKKNASNITWGEKDPRKAFRLDGRELKAFMATRRSMSVMTLYRRAKKQKSGLTMADCQGIEDALGWSADKELPKLAKEYGTTIKDLVRYIRRQADGERTFGMAFRTWKDYMTAAEAVEMRIYREDVKFPKDLWTAHEEAAEQNRKRLEREHRKEMRRRQAAEKKWKEEQAEKERRALLAYADRKKTLEKRYGYAAEGLVFRVPENREEIVAEGKVLQHCVGGYADRHIDGAVTILFLRKEAAPDKPFLTVEMNGDKLVQIHGYKNEGLYTTKGRFAPDPREVYKDFLDPWLDWVASGSRRNKKGEPVRSRQKVEVQIA